MVAIISVQNPIFFETEKSLRKFLEPTAQLKVTDNSPEFGKACEKLSWNHCTFTSHADTTLTSRACTRANEMFLVREAQGPTRLKCLDCSISVRVILKQLSQCSHARFSTLLGPPFTAPSQSTSTSSSLLLLSKSNTSQRPCVSLEGFGLLSRGMHTA